MTSKVFYSDWHARPTKDVCGGIRRKVITTDNIMVVKYLYEPGALFPDHHHPQEQIVMVTRGELEFWVKDNDNYDIKNKKYHLYPGSILTLPGNIPHGARVIGNETVESINIFYPIKEEFLSETEKK